MTILDATGVLSKRHVHLPVKIVLDAPVIAQDLPITPHRTPLAADEVPHLATGFPIHRPLRIAFANHPQLSPRLLIPNPLRACDDLVPARLMPPIPILLCPIGLILVSLELVLIGIQY